MKSTIIFLGLIIVSAVFYFSSCTQDVSVTHTGLDTVNIGGSNSSCAIIKAGQTIDAGTICFTDVDTDNNGYDDLLKVCYATTGGWVITEAHFHIGNTVASIPVTKKGNPIPGQFAYNSGVLNNVTSYCFDIPFSELEITCPGIPVTKYYAAHCVVSRIENGVVLQTETGWGQGPGFAGSNWAMYNYFVLTCDVPPPPPPPNYKSETAFAKSTDYSTCFIDHVFIPDQYMPRKQNNSFDTFERWGWSNGPLAAGTYNFPIYAGAGQCNLYNGTQVGNLHVVYDGNTAVISYILASGFTMTEAQLYAGALPLALNNGEYTVSPGQYPHNSGPLSNVSSYSYTFNGLTGNIFIVAHAVVWGNY